MLAERFAVDRLDRVAVFEQDAADLHVHDGGVEHAASGATRASRDQADQGESEPLVDGRATRRVHDA